MSHPVHEANENSPYGMLTRQEFHKKHQIIHQQKIMLNKQNMKIFTQSWRHDSSLTPRGVVAMIHGYATESSWLFELTAVAIAKAGFIAYALDLQGHGFSDGHPGRIHNVHVVIDDCIQFFDSVRGDHPKLPAFLYGESLGGALALLISLKQKTEWTGLILNGAMCGISKNIKPMWPLEKLLPLAACIAPNARIRFSRSPASKSYKEEWKRKLVSKSPNRHRLVSRKPPAATALQFFRVCTFIKRNCGELKIPMLIVHGGDDGSCDPIAAMNVYKSAASKDKTIRIFEGMWHMLIGEPNESVELVFGTIISWIGERADKARNKYEEKIE